MAAILWTLMVVLSALGALTLLDWLLPAAWTPEEPVETFCLLPIEGSAETWERRLRWAHSRMRQDEWGKQGCLLLLDQGADEELLAISRAFVREKPDAAVCTPSQLMGLLKEGSVCKCLRGILY